MNYPVWDLTTFGGGFLIALVAVVHVLVSHFAVGGGAFLVLLEGKAYRQDNADLLGYVKKHSKFFMLLTMVFGGITGVGIWWTIALLNPAATSALIHIFVFGWAAEWVFFVVEIVALFIYFYTFDKMERKNHMLVGWIYFISAWMSLFLINGIIDFMLTPGAWLDNHSFWSGFFNPTFWPALVFRTGISLVLCGVFGFVTAAFLNKPRLRQELMRTCAIWVTAPFVLMLAGGWWYFQVLPEPIQAMILTKSPEMGAYLQTLLWFLPLLFLAALFMALRLPQAVQKGCCFFIIAIALIYFGAFEFIREGARRPFIIHDHMYSNQVYLTDLPRIEKAGFLATARWTSQKKVDPANLLASGQELFKLQCSACHSIGGPLNNIKPLVKKYADAFGMDAMLNGLGKLNNYMPHFLGNRQERWALANYIVKEINGVEDPTAGQPAVAMAEQSIPIPKFAGAAAEYVLLAWNSTGMHSFSDSSPYWSLMPPGNTIYAQLVKRGDSPEIVTAGVDISYAPEPDFEHPEQQIQFWDFAPQLLGLDLIPGIGTAGKRVSGTMSLDQDRRAFLARDIPLVPYPAEGDYNPYPLLTITARDQASGQILATTRMVAPTATEMGCKNCHGGGWKVNGIAGITATTSLDILATHDKNSGTDLVKRAQNGEPMLCQSCHADPLLGTQGKPGLLNFSAAIHGWHANFLTDREGPTACSSCHPSRADGPTRFFRSHHSQFMDCTNCHGTMEDHAISLLKQEQTAGKTSANRLLANLSPRNAASVAAIKPRTPWVNLPDCLNCHEDFQMGMTVDAFNTWTAASTDLYRNRRDQMDAMMCEACHSSPHAVYPATFNVLGSSRDSIQPLQYQGNDRPIGNDCTVCHTVQPEFEGHHPNSLRQ